MSFPLDYTCLRGILTIDCHESEDKKPPGGDHQTSLHLPAGSRANAWVLDGRIWKIFVAPCNRISSHLHISFLAGTCGITASGQRSPGYPRMLSSLWNLSVFLGFQEDRARFGSPAWAEEWTCNCSASIQCSRRNPDPRRCHEHQYVDRQCLPATGTKKALMGTGNSTSSKLRIWYLSHLEFPSRQVARFNAVLRPQDYRLGSNKSFLLSHVEALATNQVPKW